MSELEKHLPRWVLQIEALKKEAERRLKKREKRG
jgi:hypothetical protein